MLPSIKLCNNISDELSPKLPSKSVCCNNYIAISKNNYKAQSKRRQISIY